MKIILWGINYTPESIGIAPFNRELCEYLASRGHEVTAVTSFPYYPQWRKQPQDRGRLHRAELSGGVMVHRCWCYVPTVVTSFRRMLHELSFGLASLLQVLWLPRADVYLVVSPPLVLGFFAWLATALKQSRFVFHVQDLQPDAAVGLGMIKGGGLIQALYALERFSYTKAAVVSGISEGMLRAFREKGVPDDRRVLLPNWLRTSRAPAAKVETRSSARRHFAVPEETLLAFYAGNLGRKQNLEILIDAAVLLDARRAPRQRKIKLIIAGDGSVRRELEQRVRDHPGICVELLPLLSDADYATLLVAADLALITQAPGTGQFFFPSKLLSVLAAGLPVVAVADQSSELVRAIEEGQFGCVVRPGEAADLAAVLEQLAQNGRDLKVWAENTKWIAQFAAQSIFPRFENILHLTSRGFGVQPPSGPESPLTV